MPDKYINIHNLKVSESLTNFVNEELLKDTNISPKKFWEGFNREVHELASKNKKLIHKFHQLKNQLI